MEENLFNYDSITGDSGLFLYCENQTRRSKRIQRMSFEFVYG